MEDKFARVGNNSLPMNQNLEAQKNQAADLSRSNLNTQGQQDFRPNDKFILKEAPGIRQNRNKMTA